MTDATFVAVWEVDPLNSLPALLPAAEQDLYAMCVAALVEPVGPPHWSLDGDRLVARVPARPLPGRPQRDVPWDRYENGPAEEWDRWAA